MEEGSPNFHGAPINASCRAVMFLQDTAAESWEIGGTTTASEVF